MKVTIEFLGVSYSDEFRVVPLDGAKKRLLAIFILAIVTGSLLKKNGNVKKAAIALGKDRANFNRWVKLSGVNPAIYRKGREEDEEAD